MRFNRSLPGRAGKQKGLLVLLALALLACQPRVGRVEILAPDTEIHLGDQPDLVAPWKPLYGDFAPARAWQGDFYVPDPGGVWELTLEVMAANDRANLVLINDQRLNPPSLRPRDWDFAAYWVRQHFGVPRGLLKKGRNTFRLEVGQWLPVYQNPANLWEDLQVRNIYLRSLN